MPTARGWAVLVAGVALAVVARGFGALVLAPLAVALILLPVLAAAFMSLVHVNDLHRRVARYEELRGRLEAARKEASHAQTWGALERVVARVERALLQEVFEWHSLTSLSEAH